jgi:hypothetical protein
METAACERSSSGRKRKGEKSEKLLQIKWNSLPSSYILSASAQQPLEEMSCCQKDGLVRKVIDFPIGEKKVSSPSAIYENLSSVRHLLEP